CNVHQTSRVTGYDYVRPALLDAIDLVLKYGPRDVRVFDREESPKTATHLGLLQFHKLHASYCFQDTFGLGPDIEFAKKVTRLMQRDLALEVGADIINAE